MKYITVMGRNFHATAGAIDELEKFRVMTAEAEKTAYKGYVLDVETSLHDVLIKSQNDNEAITKKQLKKHLLKLHPDIKESKQGGTRFDIRNVSKTHWFSVFTLLWLVIGIVMTFLLSMEVKSLPSSEQVTSTSYFYGATVSSDGSGIPLLSQQDADMFFDSIMKTLGVIAAVSFVGVVVNIRARKYLKWRPFVSVFNVFFLVVPVIYTVWSNAIGPYPPVVPEDPLMETMYISLCGSAVQVDYTTDGYFEKKREGFNKVFEYESSEGLDSPLFSEQFCKDYFSLLEKYPKQDIVAMYYIKDSKGQEYPNVAMSIEEYENRSSAKYIREKMSMSHTGLFIKSRQTK